MGTSGMSGGPQSSDPLVPSWLDEPDFESSHDGSIDLPDESDESNTAENQDESSDQQEIVHEPNLARFQSARLNFTAFAKSSGSNRGALKRAVRDYVRKGSGGSRRATKRMGASRTAGREILTVFRGIKRDGADETLEKLNLTNLIGQSVTDVFIGLTDIVCKEGGSIDEGIARDAWLETVAELDRFSIDDLDELTIHQIQEVFMSFVSNSIQTRLFQDIGRMGFLVAEDPKSIEVFEGQLRDYILRAVRDAYSSDLSQLTELSDRSIRTIVDKTYQDSWELLSVFGDIGE